MQEYTVVFVVSIHEMRCYEVLAASYSHALVLALKQDSEDYPDKMFRLDSPFMVMKMVDHNAVHSLSDFGGN